MNLIMFFILCAVVAILTCVTIIAYVIYKFRTEDVISIDNISDKNEYQMLKQIAGNPKALRRICEEYNAGLYDDLD